MSGPRSDDAVEVAAPSGLATRQRIFQREKRRYAVRLEEGFWSQLEECAREEGRKLSDFLLDAMDSAGRGENRTAALRLFCLRWLRERLVQARHSAGNLDIQTVLSACPSPCVIMTKEKAIIAYNTAFAQNIVNRIAASDGVPAGAAPMTFKLETPLEEIHKNLLSGKVRFSDTSGAFVKHGKAIKVLARFCLLETNKGANTPLLCFLIAG